MIDTFVVLSIGVAIGLFLGALISVASSKKTERGGGQTPPERTPPPNYDDLPDPPPTERITIV